MLSLTTRRLVTPEDENRLCFHGKLSTLFDFLPTSGWQGLMPPLMLGAAHPGKSFIKVSTLERLLRQFDHNRAKEPVFLLALLIIVSLEILIVVVEDLPQGKIGGRSGC